MFRTFAPGNRQKEIVPSLLKPSLIVDSISPLSLVVAVAPIVVFIVVVVAAIVVFIVMVVAVAVFLLLQLLFLLL